MARRVQSFEYGGTAEPGDMTFGDMPQRSNSFTAYTMDNLSPSYLPDGLAEQDLVFHGDPLNLQLSDLLDESLFIQDWSGNDDPFRSGTTEPAFNPDLDSQQDLLESQHLTELFRHSPQRYSPGNKGLQEPFVGHNSLYGISEGLTQSSPALISTLSEKRPRRSLPRRKSHYGLYSAGRRAVAIPQPLRQVENRRERLNTFETPLERWHNSPPGSEPAPISAIHEEYERRQLVSADLHGASLSDINWTAYRTHSRANSATGSEASEQSAMSNASEKSSASQRAHKLSQKRKIRNKRQHDKSTVPEEQARIFKCTFCCDDFKHKYDWARHERSKHLNIGGWRCAPFGPAVTNSYGRLVCAYCNILDPNADHIETHNYQACLKALGGSHVFQRKDHLTQNLRLVHRLDTAPLIEDWKVHDPIIRSRCGFCDIVMQTWDERTEHLAAHFRSGLSMDDWRGGHDFEDSVADQINNCIPPWLIKFESKSIIPFSTTNHASRDQFAQHFNHAEKMGDRALMIELEQDLLNDVENHDTIENQVNGRVSLDMLTNHLSRFAKEQMALGQIPTDKMFQAEARKMFYGDGDDEWNTTVADDSTWLSGFRQRNRWEAIPDS